MDEAISQANRSSSFLLHMMVMVDPQQLKSNEIVKVSIVVYDVSRVSHRLREHYIIQDAYEECLQLKEYLSEQLWSEFDNDGISSVQSALEELTQALNKYEMTNDMVEGEWYVYIHVICVHRCEFNGFFGVLLGNS